METQPIPLKIRLPYKILGVLFGALALLSFLFIVSSISRNLFMFALMSMTYTGLNGIMAYGFWKMRKWIVPLLGGTTLIVAIINIANIIGGTQKISQALMGFVILGALFIFAYFSRKFLNGDYKNLKALGLFAGLLVLSQVVIFLLK